MFIYICICNYLTLEFYIQYDYVICICKMYNMSYNIQYSSIYLYSSCDLSKVQSIFTLRNQVL